ncbi:hypothetical protein A2973_01050 [Candidatus Gottesmanbacteria bacterium RIFCSPLOWO2_01_FULL_49_10]|uniref:Uncharacterized protein n=1 Tax=Candidatus Gottesmanbacteria bacterium RIFCSPLOWO2_01_FULL_49_10 TaxID=1798396 RepID=A0A1F6B012_9BACT|nr:MAG: hypothetical protein A2973_01050 [Candidatus Gottesmanbacteria bacterium RIFCSPLOWO2_01_FULL_49_10]
MVYPEIFQKIFRHPYLSGRAVRSDRTGRGFKCKDISIFYKVKRTVVTILVQQVIGNEGLKNIIKEAVHILERLDLG